MSHPTRSFSACILLTATALAAATSTAFAAPPTNGKIGGMQGSPDLRLWLDASQGVTLNAGAVDVWADQSGNGNDVSAAAATNRPGYNASALNGRGALVYDGTNDYLLNNAVNGSIFPDADATVFSVFEAETAPAPREIYDTGTGGVSRRTLFQIVFGGVSLFRESSGSEHVTVAASNYTDGENLLFTGLYNGANSRVTVYGTSVNNGATSTGNLGTSSTPNGSPLVIGRRYANDANFHQGLLSELVIFDSVLNTAQEKIVQNNLGSKYDRPLTAAANEYAGDTLASGNYDRDVFGVGRADASNLHIAGGMSGFGIEATGGSLDANDEWVLAGHKVATNSLVAIEGSMFGQRWNRSWFVDKTGGVDALLAFDFSDSGLAYSGQLPGDLLYRASELSNWMITGLVPAVVGDTFTFALTDAQLLDGYYTLAVGIPEPASVAGVAALGALALLRRRR